ncbi:MAG: fasciclin domain-containing protein [Pseudomonadota bacterium]
MHEAGDEPDALSGLREGDHASGYEDGELPDDQGLTDFDEGADPDNAEAAFDDPREDTVFLAPRRDFSPAGMARDQGADADIESPFAEVSSKPRAELMSPIRQPDAALERSDRPVEADAPPDEIMPVVERPVPRKEPPPALSLIADLPGDEPGADQPSSEPPTTTARQALPLDDPTLIRPRPVWQTPTKESGGLPSGLRRRPLLADANSGLSSSDRPSADPAAAEASQPLSPPVVPPFTEADEAFPRRRPVGVVLPRAETSPEAPPPPARPRLAFLAAKRAGGTLLTGLGAAWVIYSGKCLALQAWLSKRAVSALSQARPLVSSSGTASLRLAAGVAQRVRAGGAGAWNALRLVAPHALAVARTTLSSLQNAGAHAIAATGQLSAFVPTAFGGLSSKVEHWMAARAEQRAEKRAKAVEAAKAAKVAKVIQAAERLKAQARAAATPLEAASRPLPASKVFEPPSVTTAAASRFRSRTPPPPKPIELPATPKPAAEAVRQPKAYPSKGLGMPKAAWAGLAAASVVFLVAAVAVGPRILPARAGLTVPIPEKPLIGALPPNGPKDLARGLANAASDQSSGLEAALSLPELKDPIKEMVAYVEAEKAPAPAVDPTSPVLARARGEEGLSQFALAAEVVGLGKLMEPGEDYTIFAPSDQAFAGLAVGEFERLLDPSGHERLLTLLSHHVLPVRLRADRLQGDVLEYTSLAGEAFRIDATAAINVGGAGLIGPGLEAENGVLHVIDRVLPVTAP